MSIDERYAEYQKLEDGVRKAIQTALRKASASEKNNEKILTAYIHGEVMEYLLTKLDL